MTTTTHLSTYLISLPTPEAAALEKAAFEMGWTIRKIGDFTERIGGGLKSTGEKR